MLAHDWLVGLRGGEWVLDAIAQTAAEVGEVAGLYVMFDDRRGVTPAIDALPRVVSRLGRLPGASTRLRRWLLPLYSLAVEELSRRLAEEHARSAIDLVVSTSSAAIKGLRAPDGVPHVCYCHSPARYVWSQTEEYSSGLRGLGLRVAGEAFRKWDLASAANVTRFLANSTHTAKEIRRCYGREAEVVFPPVRTQFFTPPPPGARRGEHWLVVSALEPYKRVDLAIGAAQLAGTQLRIVGGGSELRRLRRLAGPETRFLGRVSDEALREEYRSARLLLFPQVEDFGIVAVEAQACGLPVVARRAGGALDSVLDEITGALFLGDTPLALLSGVARCPRAAEYMCRAQAERFCADTFSRKMSAMIGAGTT
ncbi:D-inositol 3-phosphate glycosyltransferase [Phycisphaerales bacterium]|nr:D-inositol 3-phosphate glycosyltransferase [Phycisphaerales bacterium]